MNHIGNVIKTYRTGKGLSQKKLAEDICSSKYVYLIEKGERTPSSDMLRLFSEKLGVDFFHYYRYLDCDDPIGVCEMIRLFKKCKLISDFGQLDVLTRRSEAMPDFCREPWSYELVLNHFTVMILVEGRVREALERLYKTIARAETAKCLRHYLVQLNTQKALCLNKINDTENAYAAIRTAHGLVKNRELMSDYVQVKITVAIIYLFICFSSGRFEEMLREGTELMAYEVENNLYERIHYTYFLLSLAHFRLGNLDEVRKYARDVLFTILCREKETDVRFFMRYETFTEILRSGLIEKCLVSDFCSMYRIDPAAFEPI